jgi:ATP-dependent RNA helicase DeaD
MTAFSSFGLPSFMTESLGRMNITNPTPIQGKAIPPGLEGLDILASAQTGTGKTLAYLIPLVTNLLKDTHSSALVLAPTRELAAQIQQAAHFLFGKKMSLNTALLIGGESMGKQLSALKRNPRLIVGTPGRLCDHLARRTLRLQETRFLVLDEMDRMLDMGFSEALKKIVQCLPKERQTFMFSATMPPSIKTLSAAYLTDPQHISIGSTTTPSLQVKQESLQVLAADKFPLLLRELNDREGSVIIFVKTKHGADRLAEKLSNKNHPAAAIHGDLKQRKRDEVIRDFRNLKHRIVVATDLAARGLDIPHIKHVINYDLPQCPEDYIHRIGRTGRAGMEGCALSLIAPEDNQKWRRIHTLIHPGKAQPVPANTDTPKKSRPFQKKAGESKGSYQKPDGARRDRSFQKPDGERRDRSFQKPDGERQGRSFQKPDGERQGRSFQKPDGERQGRSFQKPDGARRDRSFQKPDGERQGRSFQESAPAKRGGSFSKPSDSKRRQPFQGGKPFQGATESKREGPARHGPSKRRQSFR